jgi:two-component system phosphate regulon response regulator PhoB
MNICIVEDDFHLASLLKQALHEYEAYICSGFEEAYACLDQIYDCYLIDLRLPDGSGMELCRLIRQRYQRPILIISSDSSEGSILQGYKLDVDDYIEKPFRLPVLKAKIHHLLKRYNLLDDILCTGIFSFDKNTRILSWQESQVRFSPAEAVLVERLLSQKPASRQELLNLLYCLHNEESSENSLNVRISAIKKKLTGAPMQIVTIPKFGYQWVLL